MEYDEPWKGLRLDGRTLVLSLGMALNAATGQRKQVHVSARLAEPLPDWFESRMVRQLRIVKEGRLFYAVFTVDRPVPSRRPVGRVIAIDPNHKNLGYGGGTDGVATEIRNPWFLKMLDRRIDEVKSLRDRCPRKSVRAVREDGTEAWLPSRGWRKLKGRLEELGRVRREPAKVYLRTVAHRLYREYDAVFVGDYAPPGGGISRGIRRAMHNQSLIGRFKETLAWVAARSGKGYGEWATRTFRACHFKVLDGIPPEVREWTCPECGTHHNRDENAAMNGLAHVLKKVECLARAVLETKSSLRPGGLGGSTV